MSTKATLAISKGGDEVAWHLYEEAFEPGVVYLHIDGILVDVSVRDFDGASVVLRLPIATAEALGLHSIVPAPQWAIACSEKRLDPLRRTALRPQHIDGQVHSDNDPELP